MAVLELTEADEWEMAALLRGDHPEDVKERREAEAELWEATERATSALWAVRDALAWQLTDHARRLEEVGVERAERAAPSIIEAVASSPQAQRDLLSAQKRALKASQPD